MKEHMRNHPETTAGKIVRKVTLEASIKYGDDEDMWHHIVAELGPEKAMEKLLIRIRMEVIGKTPKNRNQFDPNYFLSKIYGLDHGIITMDSNKLKDNWREKIKNLEEFRASKRFSVYRWENHDDKVRSYEDNDDIEGDHDDLSDESDIDAGPNIPDLSDRDLPKRIICFSSQKLLKLFSKCAKSSVDGTFKSSSVLWSQQFIWMIKEKHSWIPAIWGWLPDKTEQTYKVFF